MDITNRDVLKQVLNTTIQDLLRDVAHEIADKLFEIIQTDWYDSHYPNYYERTYEFLHAVTNSNVERVGSELRTDIYIDPSKITSSVGNGFWNQHMSLDGSTSYDGTPIGQWLIQWIEEGQNSRVYSYNGIGMFDKLDQYTMQNINKMVVYTLKSYGFSVKT